jgi:hypothetical protein
MSYYMMPGKATEYQKWLKSDKMKDLFNQLENETGMRHLNTYMPILGLGDYDCEDWYIIPNWAALDKLRSSKAYDILNINSYFLWIKQGV